MFFFQKMAPKSPQIFYIIVHFLTHIDVLMLCTKFELIPSSIFQVMAILRKCQKSLKNLYYSPWFFVKKWLRNHPQFILHFLIHIDVLMLCSKIELIPTSIFQVTAILRKFKIKKKIPVLYSPRFFPKNGSKFLLHFLIHIVVHCKYAM